MPVDGLTGHRHHARGRRRITRQIASAVVGFGEDHIVDIGRLDSGPADRFLQDRGREDLGGSVDQ